MIGTSLATIDTSASWGTTAVELPDVVAHVVTMQQRNQDNFGSEYGYKGVDYDYQALIRNSRESPVVGRPSITRHNMTFNLTKRSTVSAGVVTAAIPYQVSMTLRFPETGIVGLAVAAWATMSAKIINTDGAILKKMINFES